ncbi:sodium/proline symporter [Methylotuvimicrobium sp. KM2]|uniref:sodium/proline symporter n=1 Tax=Methylotuvimicrobium sp. KM2 TaxID=3133976 RepID=UPI0031010856
MVLSFSFFLLLFTLIGLASYWQSRGTKQDYYLASGNVKPWLVGLSAVATNNSGYMFIGVIGYTYVTGLAAIWLMIGWIAGDFLASLLVHKRLKAAATITGEVSYAGVLSVWSTGGGQPALQRVIGVISLVFLLAYASAQLVAGSKALHVLFGWPSWAGAVMGGILVTLYCFAGGIRASIWTDAAQSIVMIVAMSVLLMTATQALGGVESTLMQMQAIDGFLDWFPKSLALPGIAGGLLFAISWLFAGLSVIGQPHIMVRFMTLDDTASMNKARLWYYLWYIAFYLAATGVGLLSRIYLVDTEAFDAELALPTMAMELLSPALVGLILAGLFAATMSTADSVVLSCSAALTHDILPHQIENQYLIKGVTIVVTFLALLGALANNHSVFSLVIMAWSGLASAFAPLLLVLCVGMRPTQFASLAAVASGLAVAILWRYLDLHEKAYEGLAGIVTGLIILCLAELFRHLWNKHKVNVS